MCKLFPKIPSLFGTLHSNPLNRGWLNRDITKICVPLQQVNIMSETADIILTCRGKHLYFSWALSRHHHGDTKLTKTKPFAAGKDWPVTTTAQIWGRQRFQGRFWKILKVAFMSLADGLTDSSKEKRLHSPLGEKDSFGIDSAHLGSPVPHDRWKLSWYDLYLLTPNSGREKESHVYRAPATCPALCSACYIQSFDGETA